LLFGASYQRSSNAQSLTLPHPITRQMKAELVKTAQGLRCVHPPFFSDATITNDVKQNCLFSHFLSLFSLSMSALYSATRLNAIRTSPGDEARTLCNDPSKFNIK
jgi:hypothetical protein